MRYLLERRNIEIAVPDRNWMGAFGAEVLGEIPPAEDLIRRALENPIGTPPLSDLVRGSRRVLILIDDNTRPTPGHLILPPLLDYIQEAGITYDRCTILIAGGTHRKMTEDEIVEKLGRDTLEKVRVVSHGIEQDHLFLQGVLEDGTEVWLNREVKEHDFLIGIGEILPHGIIGFSGGSKIVAPGICGTKTIQAVHWGMHEVPRNRLYGVRDNAARERVDGIGREAGLRFIVNVITDGSGRIADVAAGDPVEAHRWGCRRSFEIRSVRLPEQPDIVIADSHPMELDYWQAIKALTSAGLVCKPGGIIIQIADCPEGFSPHYRDPLKYGYVNPQKVVSMVEDGTINGAVGAHMLLAGNALHGKSAAYLSTKGLSRLEVESLGFRWADDISDAVDRSLKMMPDARIALLLEAALIIPFVAGNGSD